MEVPASASACIHCPFEPPLIGINVNYIWVPIASCLMCPQAPSSISSPEPWLCPASPKYLFPTVTGESSFTFRFLGMCTLHDRGFCVQVYFMFRRFSGYDCSMLIFEAIRFTFDGLSYDFNDNARYKYPLPIDAIIQHHSAPQRKTLTAPRARITQ